MAFLMVVSKDCPLDDISCHMLLSILLSAGELAHFGAGYFTDFTSLCLPLYLIAAFIRS